MNERLRILQLIESGEISVEDGVRRLQRLSGSEAGLGPEPEQAAPGVEDVAAPEASPQAGPQAESAGQPVRPSLVRIVWRTVFAIGVALVAGGGFLLARAYSSEGIPGLTWGWVLFALGVGAMALGWWLQRARWFYLRVREHEGRAFTIALPLPLGLVVWLVRVAEPFVPQLQGLDADRLILAMRDELRDGRGMTITVDEGEAGDQVELYFR